jgi:hypothetical protein
VELLVHPHRVTDPDDVAQGRWCRSTGDAEPSRYVTVTARPSMPATTPSRHPHGVRPTWLAWTTCIRWPGQYVVQTWPGVVETQGVISTFLITDPS